jgi:hypothetical protein
LDSEPPRGDAVLGKSQLLQCGASSDLDLSRDQINPGDLLGNRMLDLDTGVDLDEVVSVLLVDQELGGSGISVVDRPSKLDGIGQEGIANVGREVLGRGQLDDFLMSSLNGTITLVEVDDVSVVVSQELDLDMLRLVQESLHEDGSVAKGRLGLGRGPVEGVLQGGLLPDNSHTASTTSIGRLDDDGESVLIRELLDILELVNGPLCTWDNRDAGLDSYGSGRDFIAEGVDDFGRGADELHDELARYESQCLAWSTYDKTGLLNIPSKHGIFGEETVSYVGVRLLYASGRFFPYQDVSSAHHAAAQS